MKGTRVSDGKGNGCVFDARRKGQGEASIQTNGDVQSNFRFCRYKRDVPREPDRPMDRAFLINFHHVPLPVASLPFFLFFFFFAREKPCRFLIPPFPPFYFRMIYLRSVRSVLLGLRIKNIRKNRSCLLSIDFFFFVSCAFFYKVN